MQPGIFTTVLYQPLYNSLVYILSVVPGANVGVAIILLTLAVRGVLLPLSHKQVVSMSKMRKIAPHVEKLKEKHKNDKQEQARKTMELYREHGINPFSGCLLMFVQLPILFALYFVFFKGLPHLNAEYLYSFVSIPLNVEMFFLGVDLSGKSVVFALVAAISQYYQIKLSIPALPPAEKGAQPSFKDDFARSMNVQMRYMLPVIVFGVSYTFSAAIALYWATSNLFSVAHELYVARKARELIK